MGIFTLEILYVSYNIYFFNILILVKIFTHILIWQIFFLTRPVFDNLTFNEKPIKNQNIFHKYKLEEN